MDWNIDGKLDLVFGEREGHLNLYTGNGNGTLHYVGHIFSDANTEIMTNFNSSPYLVDWNQDGKLDLLMAGYLTEATNGGVLRVYPGVGDDPDSPVFDADFMNYTTFYNQWRTTAQTYDLDADGDKDLVLGYEMGEVYYASNIGTNANPQFSSFSVLQTAAGPMNVYTNFQGGGRARECVCDYNSDGIPDILVGCNSGWIYVFLGYYLGVEDHEAPTADELTLGIQGSPGSGIFQFELTVPTGLAAELIVMDASGRLVEEQSGLAGPGSIDLSGAPAGMYMVTASCAGSVVTDRLIKL